MKSSEDMILAFCNCVKKPEKFRTSNPEIFRLLYAIAKIAFITAKIIASLDSLENNVQE